MTKRKKYKQRHSIDLNTATKEVKQIYKDVDKLLDSSITGYEIGEHVDIDMNTVYQIRRGERTLDNIRFVTVAELHKFYRMVKGRVDKGG